MALRLLYLSSGHRGCFRPAQLGEDFPDDVAFQAAYDLAFAFSFLGTFADIGKRWLVVAHANDRNPVQGGIGLSVATAIKPEPISLSACCGDWTHAAKLGQDRKSTRLNSSH